MEKKLLETRMTLALGAEDVFFEAALLSGSATVRSVDEG